MTKPQRLTAKVAGTSFDGRQSTMAFVHRDDPVTLRREPDNAYDRNAIAIDHARGNIGYIPKVIAADLAPKLDDGCVATAKVTALQGGSKRHRYLGATIEIEVSPNPTPFDDDVTL